MPNIKEYAAPPVRLNPSDRAQQAWETAGRRIGPLYNQAAQDQAQAGRVLGDMEKAKAWPFDIYALRESNAPRVTESSGTETSIKPGAQGGGGGGGGRAGHTDNFGLSGFSGGTIDPSSYPAPGGTDAPWSYEHGEASAGAVGMSRLARAAATGGGGGIPNPNSDIPANAKDDPNYNGQNVVDTPNGQFTPAQLDRMSGKYMDAWNRNMAKWNRDQNAYWNGPNGFNTRRDKWLDANDQAWQKDYDADLTNQEKAVRAYMKQNPDADIGAVRQQTYDHYHVTPPVQATTGSYEDENSDYRIHYGTPTVGDYVRYAPNAIVDSVKSTFNSMFGNSNDSDEPAATAEIQ